MDDQMYKTLMEELGPLSELEETVMQNVRKGVMTEVADGSIPTSPLASNVVRASLLNFLFRNSKTFNLVSNFGVQIKGACIPGEINLSGCILPYGIRLMNCVFDHRIYAPSLKADRIHFHGSQLCGLYLERAKINGSLFCHQGFYCKGKVTLTGASINGTVSFEGARIETNEVNAIIAERCKITDSLRFTQGFSANGKIQILGAHIGGQLIFNGCRVDSDVQISLNAQRIKVGESVFVHKDSKFKGNLKFAGMQVQGQLILRDLLVSANEEGRGSIDLENTNIGDSLVMKRLSASGKINMTNASVKSLNDELGVWSMASEYCLENFRYDQIHGESYEISTRLKWIKDSRQSEEITVDDDSSETHFTNYFTPQPYQQLAHVVGEMGHRRDRKLVLYRMEQHLKGWQIDDLKSSSRLILDGTLTAGIKSLTIDIKLLLFRVMTALLQSIVGYGYKPQNSVFCALGIIFFASIIVNEAYKIGDFAPTAAPILISEQWQQLSMPPNEGGYQNPAMVWSAQTGEGRDYTTFNGLYYAADLFVPLVDFDQDSSWSPSTSRSKLGVFLHWIEPVIRLLGWLVTALGAAALAGLVRND